jgi:SAM-dependent methyltransferase
MSTYLFQPSWEGELRRLQTLEQEHDAATERLLAEVGVAPGWQCLEIGAGTGSIARWLARAVAPTGCVVATDIDLRFLEGCQEPGLEIRRHDITTEAFQEEFDLVHARLVLEHLPQPEQIFDTLVAALRPGGFLVVEDLDDCTIHVQYPPDPERQKVIAALEALFKASGRRPFLGRELPHLFMARGLSDVAATARGTMTMPGTASSEGWRLLLAQMGPMLVRSGLVSADEVDSSLAKLGEPRAESSLGPLLISVRGRKA